MQLFIVFIGLIYFTNAKAQDVHFFGSIDYAKTTTKNDVEFNNGITNRYGASILSSAGLNVAAKVDDQSRALVQVIHAPQPNKIILDLIQYQRNFSNNFKVRVGQQRLPIFLKSEVIQVKALYPWASAPVEVYGLSPFKSFTGISAEKSMQDFGLHLYGGTIRENFYNKDATYEVVSKQMLGSRLNYNRDGLDAYFNFFTGRQTDVNIQTPTSVSGSLKGTYYTNLPVRHFETYTTGFSWDVKKWLIMSEYIRTNSTSVLQSTAESAYQSLGYHFTEKFMLIGTYSNAMLAKSDLSPSSTTSYDMTFQYAIDSNAVLKLGMSHVNFHRKTKPNLLSSGQVLDTSSGLSGAPGNNFNVYDLQLAFVF